MSGVVHPCAVPRCGALLPIGVTYCPAHRRATEGGRASSGGRGYDSRWQRRAQAFRRRYPLCGMRPNGLAPVLSRCHAEGRITAAVQVDHVVPHRGDPRLMWDELGNWQSLCGSCGAAKTRAGL